MLDATHIVRDGSVVVEDDENESVEQATAQQTGERPILVRKAVDRWKKIAVKSGFCRFCTELSHFCSKPVHLRLYGGHKAVSDTDISSLFVDCKCST